jgi:hypothetical protein
MDPDDLYVSDHSLVGISTESESISRHKPDETLLESACVPVPSVLTASDTRIHQQQLLTSFTFYRLLKLMLASAASTLTHATICHSLTTLPPRVTLLYQQMRNIFSALRSGVPCSRMTDKATRRVLRLPAHPRGRLPFFDIIRPSSTYGRCQRL